MIIINMRAQVEQSSNMALFLIISIKLGKMKEMKSEAKKIHFSFFFLSFYFNFYKHKNPFHLCCCSTIHISVSHSTRLTKEEAEKKIHYIMIKNIHSITGWG